MERLPLAFVDDAEAEEPLPPPPPTVPLGLLFASVAAGLLLLILAAKLRSSSVPRAVLNFFGCLLGSPILWLFFRAYHEAVPKIFVGQSWELRPISDSDAEPAAPAVA
jgi:hypothetical protein